MKPRQDGFTRSTALHSHGPEVNTTTTLRRLEPYVARFYVCTCYEPFASVEIGIFLALCISVVTPNCVIRVHCTDCSMSFSKNSA